MRCARCIPDERIYTFWDYFRNAYGRDAGLRIDHLLLSPPLRGRLRAAGVDRDVRGWEKASDHAPTWIELTNDEVRVRVVPPQGVERNAPDIGGGAWISLNVRKGWFAARQLSGNEPAEADVDSFS